MTEERRRATFRSSGHHCCAFGCNHKSGLSKCSFFSFPGHPMWRDRWVAAVKRCAVDDSGKVLVNKAWEPATHHRLCSCHFTSPPVAGSRKIGWNHVIPDLLPGAKAKTPRSTTKSTARLSAPPAVKKRRRLTDSYEPAEQDNAVSNMYISDNNICPEIN